MSKIFKLWLIHREIGCTILEQTFKPLQKELDSDLIGGFITAILSFSHEIADESIERMELQSFSIQYFISDHYIIAVACPKNYNENTLLSRLSILSKKFNETIVLNLADQFQKKTDYHQKNPNIN